MQDSQLWLMLVNSVSGENKTARMRIWRALRASGAVALRDGVYLLPKSESARAVFAEQAEEVVAAGGMAHIVAFDAEDDAQQREFVRLFDRSTDYAELFGKLDSLKSGIAKLDEVEARRQAAGFDFVEFCDPALKGIELPEELCIVRTAIEQPDELALLRIVLGVECDDVRHPAGCDDFFGLFGKYCSGALGFRQQIYAVA